MELIEPTLNKKYGTHTESRILHLHKIFYSASKTQEACNLMDYTPLFSIKSPIATYFTSSKLNNIDNQTLYYTMVQIW